MVPVLFTPAEDYSAEIVGCAELQQVKTAKRDGTNEITITNFRFLSSPLPRAAVTRDNGNSLAGEQYAYAICRTPADLARRLMSPTANEAREIAEIESDPTIPETERPALVQARKGQGKFRNDLDERWGHACAVTGCSIRELLRASHIKPWSTSDNGERLDPNNGLLLIANIDILFEEGFVSFDDNGRMLISSDLSAAQRRQLGLPGSLKRKPTPGQRRFLAYHREVFGFPA